MLNLISTQFRAWPFVLGISASAYYIELLKFQPDYLIHTFLLSVIIDVCKT